VVSEHQVYLAFVVSEHQVYLTFVVSEHQVYLTFVVSEHQVYLTFVVSEHQAYLGFVSMMPIIRMVYTPSSEPPAVLRPAICFMRLVFIFVIDLLCLRTSIKTTVGIKYVCQCYTEDE
jgi:hypothetical protein